MDGHFAQHEPDHSGDRISAAQRFELATLRESGNIRIDPRVLIRAALRVAAAILSLTALLAIGLTATAHAAGADSERPGLYFDSPLTARSQAPTIVADYDIRVDGPVARVSLKQRFLNPNSNWVEGVYLFPLPDGAALDAMSVEVNGRHITGRIAERAEATRQYEAAKSDGKAAARLDQQRPNMFTMHVANIPPGGDIAIDIAYWQIAPFADGAFELRTPLVVGPRYIPGEALSAATEPASFATRDVPDAASVTAPVRLDGTGNPVRLTATLNAGFDLDDVRTPYHSATITQDGERTRVTLEGDAVPADRDFVMVWKPKAGAEPTAGLFTETVGDQTYMLLMLTPPSLEKATVAPAREIVFIIDTSGSMHGDSIFQAKTALISGLERLQEGDRFNIVRFSDTTSRLWSESRDATPRNLAAAVDWISGLDADGGTEMLPALSLAFASRKPDTERLSQIVLLTDGDIGNEADLFSLIRQNLGDTRLFTVGIGSAPNGFFMRRAARFGRGAHLFIGQTSDVAEKLAQLFDKLDSAVLTDVVVQWPQSDVEMLPRQIPDLYLGEPLLITARIPSATLSGRLAVTGALGGSLWHGGVDLTAGAEAPGIARLWARAKIETIMDAAGHDDSTARRDVLPLALKHGLQTRYTSFVAVDETPIRPEDETLETRQTPGNLPKGWTRPDTAPGPDIQRASAATAIPIRLDGPGISLPRTATSSGLYLALGLLLVLTGLALLGLRIRSGRRTGALS